MPLNTESRKKAGKLITVETISLNDVIKEYFANYSIHSSDITFHIKSNKIEIHKKTKR